MRRKFEINIFYISDPVTTEDYSLKKNVDYGEYLDYNCIKGQVTFLQTSWDVISHISFRGISLLTSFVANRSCSRN